MSGFKKEEFQALLEREGVADFIWPRTAREIEGTNIVLYELANDRWGCVFQIFPSVYAADETQKKLSAFYNNNDMPDKSSIQFFSFASRNLIRFRNAYLSEHGSKPKIDNITALKEITKNRDDWFKKHSNKNIFNYGNDLRLRNIINLVCITVPRTKKHGIPFTESELVSLFSKIEQGISEFSPIKFTSNNWVAVMRELIVPNNPMWYPPNDTLTYLNHQCVDNNSVLVLNEDTSTMGIGTLLNKKEYAEMKERKTEYNDNTSENKQKKSFWNKLFIKKENEKKEAYTEWHSKIFSTKMFPSKNSLSDLTSKFYDYMGEKMSPNIPCPFYISLIVYYENRDAVKLEVSEKTKWNIWQTQSIGKAARFFPEILERAREAETINELLSSGNVPIYASWSCGIMDDSIAKVNDYGEKLKKEFQKDNWILQEESLIPHWMFLYHLPLNFEPFVIQTLAKRMNTLFNSNAASITPLVTGEKGYGSPVLTYIDRIGQVIGVDIFSSNTNKNFIVIGTSGAGKSYFMNDFFQNYLANGAKIRLIDVGRSYIELCRTLGGQYIEFTDEANICLNFFTNIELDEKGEIHPDEKSTIIPLIGLMAGIALDVEESDNLERSILSKHISSAITMAYKNRKNNAGMEDVLSALKVMAQEYKTANGEMDYKLKDLAEALYEYGDPNGSYYRYFNGVNNLNFNSDFVVLELEELDSKTKLKAVVLSAISHIIGNEFFLGDRSVKKILAIDEAWSIMDSPVVSKFLETMSRRIRKYRGASGIITQKMSDFDKNESTKAIFATTAWKFFLQQDPDDYKEAVKNGTMDKSFLLFLKTIKFKKPYYSEVLIKNDSGGYFIARLITDPVSHYIYTNGDSDMDKINATKDKYGITELQSRLLLGYAKKNSTSVEEEFYNKTHENII